MPYWNQELTLLPAPLAKLMARVPARSLLLLQLLATVFILGVIPGNAAKLALFLLVWALGFRKVSGAELWVFLGINLLFFAMNFGALQASIFAFRYPDWLGMPAYEFFMWGFYALHLMRMVGGKPAPESPRRAVLMAVVFAVPFMVFATPLFPISAALLAVVVWLFHARDDLRYAAYMLFMGVLIEYVGVATGQWEYTNPPPGGVPLWFITMWAGVGLFIRRLIVPLLKPGLRQ